MWIKGVDADGKAVTLNLAVALTFYPKNFTDGRKWRILVEYDNEVQHLSFPSEDSRDKAYAALNSVVKAGQI